MKEVRIGVVGCGGIATHAHIPNYLKIPGVKLVAVADIIEEQAKSTAERFKVESWYTDYKQLLDRDDIDGVSITTPPKWHAEIAIYAAKAGKHILCEKPLAMNVDEADAMVHAARAAGVKLMTGYQTRFSESCKKVKQFITDGLIGKPYEIIEISGMWHRVSKAWFYNKEIAGGGAGMDHLIYTAYMWQFWLGKIKKVYALMDTNLKRRPIYLGDKVTMTDVTVEDSLSILMRFANGAMGVIYKSWSSPTFHGYSEIMGSDGVILLQSMTTKRSLVVYTKKEIPELMRGWNILPLPQEEDLYFERIKHFVECIREDKEPLVTGEDGRDALEVIQAAYISAKEGRPIELPLPRKSKGGE